MKKLKFLLLIVSLLCVFFAGSMGQTTYPVHCGISAPNVVIPWNQSCATGVINLSYDSYTSYNFAGVSYVFFNGTPLNINSDWPAQVNFSVCSSGTYPIVVEYVWYRAPYVIGGFSYFHGSVTVTKQSTPQVSVGINGRNYLGFKESATYTANASGGSGNYTYQWSPGGSFITQSYTMLFSNLNISVAVHDITTGLNASTSFTIRYDPEGEDLPKRGTTQVAMPTTYTLSNYPNPFNPTTTINYQLPEASYITLKVYDVMGREVALLQDGMKEAGFHTATFDASRLTSGIYLSRLTVQPQEAKPIVQTKKLILMK